MRLKWSNKVKKPSQSSSGDEENDRSQYERDWRSCSFNEKIQENLKNGFKLVNESSLKRREHATIILPLNTSLPIVIMRRKTTRSITTQREDKNSYHKKNLGEAHTRQE